MSIKNNTTSLQEVLEIVNSLPEANSGVELPELTNPATSAELLDGKQLIDGNGNIVEGTIPTKTSSDLTASGATVTVPAGYYSAVASKVVATATQATPSITVNASGLITAATTQTAGYVAAGTKSTTKQLTTQEAITVTPTKSTQTVVAKNIYTTGAVTVAAIPDEYITTSDATAEASEIMNGETAYVNGSKVTGTFTIDEELSAQDDLISQIQSAIDNLPEAKEDPILQDKTVTPTVSSQTIVADNGYDGLNSVTVNGDENLVAENIISGVSIFGVEGNASSSGSGDEETITFSVVNNLPDCISIYGKVCFPNETTVISVPIETTELPGLPVTIWRGFQDGEYRDYYNNYSVYISYPMEGEDGEFYNEIFGLLIAPPEIYPYCALGVTEAVPVGNDCFTFYCEEV